MPRRSFGRRRGGDPSIGKRAGEQTGRRADANAAGDCEAVHGEGDAKETGGVVCLGVDGKRASIEAPVDSRSVRPMGTLLGVSASGFLTVRLLAPSVGKTEQAQSLAGILRAQTRHSRRHGSRPMKAKAGAGSGRPIHETRIVRLARIHEPGRDARSLLTQLVSGKLPGWAISATMPQELTLVALEVALGCVGRRPGWSITRIMGCNRPPAIGARY